MKEMESLSLSDPPVGLPDLPVEIVRNIIDQVVLSTGFYAALELRRVNKLFDIIVLDSVLDIDRDSHIDLGYLGISDDLAYTALHRRVTDTATRSPPLVPRIRLLTDKIHKCQLDIPISTIQQALCWAVIFEHGSLAIFNWRKGEAHNSINRKHDKLNRTLQDTEEEQCLDWYLCLVYTYGYYFARLKELHGKGGVDLDYEHPVFGYIPLIAARFSNEDLIIWCYDNSFVAKREGERQSDFLRYTTTHGRIQMMEGLIKTFSQRDGEMILSFTDCPKWATGAAQFDMLKLLLGGGYDAFWNLKVELEFVFMTACKHGNLEIAKWVVEEKGFQPTPGPKQKGLRFSRPLCQATQSGNMELVRWLMELEGLGTEEQLILSFKWAMKYAGVDMVELYFKKGVPVKSRKIVQATIKAGILGRPDHLRMAMQHGVQFLEKDQGTVVYGAAATGNSKCLKVLRELLGEYKEVARAKIQQAWDSEDRRAVETFLEDGIEKPKWYDESRIRTWNYQARMVPTFNVSRKGWGWWPYQWNYITHF
ncbi:hypothetical protein ABW20_dc0101018 [Dactylellina cionopaga]|nr:hypothetical protein ABW20_dc0101018 [Dactylellina cionopaga]